jgi:hypothetical protein
MMAERIRRWIWYATAPLIGVALYWRVPFLWFVTDDFPRLALVMDARVHGLLHVLFAPIAQGTVRVLGERLFFLTFSALFGLNIAPFLIWMQATHVAMLILILLIGAKLTRSRAAGLAAAIIWAADPNVTLAVIWPSAYYQLAGGVCLLAALYARLRWIESGSRNWRIIEWAAYIAGFGSIETTVMYPCIAALHALCCNRERLRSTLWLFVPAFLYGSAHFLMIPKSSDSVYALAVDARLGATFMKYLAWTLEPASATLRSHAEALRLPELILGALIGVALSAFLVSCVLKRKWAAAFFLGFFILLLAPCLPMPQQQMPYYLTIPSMGLAWLAGWGIVSAWNRARTLRLAALALAAVYFIFSAAGISAQTGWFQRRGERMRMVMTAVGHIVAEHPGFAVALKGVDSELFDAGFENGPFRLIGAQQVWLTPDTNLNAPSYFRVSPEELRAGIAAGDTRVLEVSGDSIRDITPRAAPKD